MSKIEKLISRFKTVPNDFTIFELEKVLFYFGYTRFNKGKTSGSRAIYVSKDLKNIILHIPHDNIVDQSCLRRILESLTIVSSDL